MDEGMLDSYLTTWIQNKYPHLTQPWFQGTILSVNGSTSPYSVTLQRLGEPGGDGGEYVVAPNPGYVPQVGDNVECVWRDSYSAYVMWPLGSPSSPAPSPGASQLAPWQVPAMQLLQRTPFANATSLCFPGGALAAPIGTLPQYFSDFQIVLRCVGNGGAGTFSDVSLILNQDTGNNYTAGQLFVGGSNAVSGSGVQAEGGPGLIAQMPGTSANMAHAIIDFPFATEPQAQVGRAAFGWSYHIEGWGSANNIAELLRNVWWFNNEPIETIQLKFTQAVSGTARLYGRA